MHRKKENGLFHRSLLSPLRFGAKSKAMLQQVVCYRSGDDIGGLDMREKSEIEDLKPTCLPALLAYLLL